MLSNYSILHWIQENNIKTEDGTPYEWRDYMFMLEVMRDMSPKVACLKAAQIGFSTAMLLKSMWVAKNKRMDIIYTLPTQSDVNQFAGGKINRIVAQNPILKEWVKDKDTVEQKTVGDSIIYYRGTFSQKAAMMVSSDLNIYDEVDASNQEVLEQYSTRLQASKYKWEWWFSHPSLTDVGIDKVWKKSDQKHWFVTCKACEKEQYLSFPESIEERQEGARYVCKHCNEELSDDDRRSGRWVQKYKDRPISGYWIPLLIAPWISAQEIMDYYHDKSAEYFYNKVLGLPYIESKNKVQRKQIMQNVVDELNTYESRTVIGVDTGMSIHLVAGNEQGLFYHSSTNGYDDFERLMQRFPDAIAVFDAQGDLQKPRELAEKYKNRIFFCWYRADRKTNDLITWKQGTNEVVADRNGIIQMVIDEFTGKRIPLYGNETDWNPYWEHWNAIEAVEEETRLGTRTRRWIRNGDDHLVHATNYWRIGMTKYGQGKAIVGKPEERNGFISANNSDYVGF